MADKMLEENVELLRDNVNLLKENIKLRKLLHEWTEMDPEPVPGDGLSMTHDVYIEHAEWCIRYEDLFKRTAEAIGESTPTSPPS